MHVIYPVANIVMSKKKKGVIKLLFFLNFSQKSYINLEFGICFE